MKFLNIRFLKIWVKYFFSKYSRYRHLYWIIIKLKPKSILEVGVYKAKRANEMIYLSKKFHNSVTYYGFDLFDKITKKKVGSELSKNPSSKQILKQYLTTIHKTSKIKLIQGNSKKTLKKFVKLKKKIDLIFIDGGHSVNTIKSDWDNIKKIMTKKTVVIFDDYYHDELIKKKFGCNKIIDNLKDKYDFQILRSTDYIEFKKRKIKNSLVRVTLRANNLFK